MSMKVRIQLSIMMFLQFVVWGAWYVPLSAYLGKIEFSAKAIGSAYATTGLAAMVSPFFVGMIADRFFPAEKVLGVLHLLGAVFLFIASLIVSPGLFFILLLLHTICYMPTLALVNAVSFSQMKDPEQEFPSIRVLGTIGWIAIGLAVSFLVPVLTGVAKPEVTPLPLQIGAGAALLTGLYSFTLPHTPPKSRGQKVTARDVLGLDALSLLKDRSFAIFIISSLLICIPLSFYFAFTGQFLEAKGFENIAATPTLGQASELFFMLVMPWFFLRLGVKKMLLVGMLAWTVRYLLFAYGNPGGLVFMYYTAILLHGICYDFFFVTGQIYVDKRASESIRASAQGFIAFVTLGVGMAVGTQLSGIVADMFTSVNDAGEKITDWQAVWLTPGIMAAVVAIFFAIFFKETAAGAAAKARMDEPNDSGSAAAQMKAEA